MLPFEHMMVNFTDICLLYQARLVAVKARSGKSCNILSYTGCDGISHVHFYLQIHIFVQFNSPCPCLFTIKIQYHAVLTDYADYVINPVFYRF